MNLEEWFLSYEPIAKLFKKGLSKLSKSIDFSFQASKQDEWINWLIFLKLLEIFLAWV